MLNKEEHRIQQIIQSLPLRETSIAGGVAMAAGFATYLGPYQYNFRRLMLTVHWPNCLRERGIPLAIDSIHQTKGMSYSVFIVLCVCHCKTGQGQATIFNS